MFARMHLNVLLYVYGWSWLVTSLISFFLYFERQGLASADLVHGNRDISLHEMVPSFFLSLRFEHGHWILKGCIKCLRGSFSLNCCPAYATNSEMNGDNDILSGCWNWNSCVSGSPTFKTVFKANDLQRSTHSCGVSSGFVSLCVI